MLMFLYIFNRFVYHFSGSKQTNRLDKPEWFFTQILSWAKDNHLFVGKTFQIAAHNSGCQELNVRVFKTNNCITYRRLPLTISEYNSD